MFFACLVSVIAPPDRSFASPVYYSDIPCMWQPCVQATYHYHWVDFYMLALQRYDSSYGNCVCVFNLNHVIILHTHPQTPFKDTL